VGGFNLAPYYVSSRYSFGLIANVEQKIICCKVAPPYWIGIVRILFALFLVEENMGLIS
jgi:hypothetical protein